MNMRTRRRYMIPLVTSLLFGALLLIAMFTLLYRSKQVTGIMMVNDIERLDTIFKRIHETCTIINFDYQKNRINFLNVTKFVGSEVGPMNLVHPERWEGPYLNDNPTMQGIEYQVVYTKKGYFITPGEKVKLPNGKIISKDIILDKSADVSAMASDKKMLMYNI